ncbi:hypothetical protein [Rhizobium leguminosarum]|uniref:hypothetical protein n=1 Tax=Rhizobium leguminosarum TaxID=384 RepID=UPI00103241E4|nr:hypothetical protein [Rhizobium leguminosarum]TAV81559.1 hypothetical protein ELI22_33945 [Rhizobium leguminosarum]TAV94165.1 hypothetical protein ELI21_10340 [Rhizobium leguminosarum]TAW35240.1 hypothetical protein ELI23_10380 [Rhizobium leguminosarum]
MIGNEYILKFNRALSYNSSLESRFTMMLLRDRHLVDLREEYPRVDYWRPGSLTPNQHLVDRYATYDDGYRIAFAVKPTVELENSGIMEIRDLILEQNTGEYFDDFVVMTDDQITPARCGNGEQIVIACDNRNERHCEIVLDHMRKIEEPTNIMAVVRALGPDIDVENSLYCLIYDGFVEHLSPDDTFDDAPFIQFIG